MSAIIFTREGIASALFTLLQGIPGIMTCSRRVRTWDKVEPQEQPALFLGAGKQIPTQSPDGLKTIWRYQFEGGLYVHNSDPTVAPATQVNELLDAIEAALLPVQCGAPGMPNSVQVLGDKTGRIRHAWIAGEIETDEGVLGDQAVAVFTVEVEVI